MHRNPTPPTSSSDPTTPLHPTASTEGPLALWTAGQVRHAIALSIAPSHHRRHDSDGYLRPPAAAIADRYDVHPDTVRRWLRQPPPTLPLTRQIALHSLFAVPGDVRRQEALDRRQHAEYLVRARLGRRRGNLAEYAHLGWLEPHLLVLIAYPDLRLHRLAVIKAPPINPNTSLGAHPTWTSPQLTRAARRGHITRPRLYPDRFTALAARDDLMDDVDPWRLAVPAEFVPHGRTTVWLEHPIRLTS